MVNNANKGIWLNNLDYNYLSTWECQRRDLNFLETTMGGGKDKVEEEAARFRVSVRRQCGFGTGRLGFSGSWFLSPEEGDVIWEVPGPGSSHVTHVAPRGPEPEVSGLPTSPSPTFSKVSWSLQHSVN